MVDWHYYYSQNNYAEQNILYRNRAHTVLDNCWSPEFIGWDVLGRVQETYEAAFAADGCMFINLIVVVVLSVYTYVKIYEIVHLK